MIETGGFTKVETIQGEVAAQELTPTSTLKTSNDYTTLLIHTL